MGEEVTEGDFFEESGRLPIVVVFVAVAADGSDFMVVVAQGKEGSKYSVYS